ncbi:hypothetical protein NVV94_10805 [Pseudomonas sp. LS1212]|uniref:hypothetical protein n=1 Tax=Pseudomonas sp. LS1212 TaxID=2972478 RepID=UPI00215CF426|nr:hypothetical protein [Pseudomonas sp. LS1212]UVJ45984.1 hypothetical protein NVV94_10805 [Pseudomonas sp. LS1212]
MSPGMERIARQLDRQKKEPVPETLDVAGLGAAIEQLIQSAVEDRVKEELEKQPPPDFNTKPTYMSYEQIPPTPKTPLPKPMEFTFGRDQLGRINQMFVGNTVFNVQRNHEGLIVRIIPSDIAPPTPGVPPAPLNRGIEQWQR